MKLQLNVTARYGAKPTESIDDVLHHFASPAWVRLVLTRVLPQLRQVSPTDPTALTKMVRDAEMHPGQEISCAICMGEQPTAALAVELPCGHRFHCGCAQSWLRRRSTCPLCRFQLPKAYTGTFAISAVESTLLLSPEHQDIMATQLLYSRMADSVLQVAVKVTMTRVSLDVSLDTQGPRPCQVIVAMLHANGSSANVPQGGGRNKREREERNDTNAVFKRGRTTATN